MILMIIIIIKKNKAANKILRKASFARDLVKASQKTNHNEILSSVGVYSSTTGKSINSLDIAVVKNKRTHQNTS